MAKNIIFIFLVGIIFFTSYKIIEPESFWGYIGVFLLGNVIAIAINFAFLGLIMLLGFIAYIFKKITKN